MSDVIVIGAGIAGSTTAYALVKQGLSVTVLDIASEAASGASGNAVGILYPRLEAALNTPTELFLNAITAFNEFMDLVEADGHTGLLQRCGVLRLAMDEQELAKFIKIADLLTSQQVIELLDKRQVSEKAGIQVCSHGALWMPNLGYVHPKALCIALLSHPKITVIYNCEALDIIEGSDNIKIHCIIDGATQFLHANNVVVACGIAAQTFDRVRKIIGVLQPVRGQLTIAPGNADSYNLQAVLCGKYGYMTPVVGGMHYLGATYDYDNLDLKLRQYDHLHNLQAWRQYLPNILPPSIHDLEGRASIRCVNRHRMPVFGEIADKRGIFVSLAHGSRGLLTSALAAKMICKSLK